MLNVTQPQQQLRKSLYNVQNNPQHRKVLLDRIGDSIGSQNFAYILITLGAIFFPLGYLYTNQNNFTVCENFMVRAISVIIINILIAKWFNMDIQFKDPHNFKILFWRNTLVTVQSIFFTLAQFYLSQPIILTITTTGPIFIFILDYFINHVTITKKQFHGVMLGVFGVLLTVNGQIIIKSIDPSFQAKSDFKNYYTSDPFVKFMVALLFTCSNLLWAYAQVITKRLNGVNSIQINVHLGFYLLFVTGIVYPSQVVESVPIEKFLLAIPWSGVLMTLGQIFFIGAVTMSKNTGILTMFTFVGVLEGYIVSIFRYNETINPICSLGGVLIILGLVKIVFKDKQSQQKVGIKDQIKTEIKAENTKELQR